MRKALSSVYGFIVIYLLTIASLGALTSVSNSEIQVRAAIDRARQVLDSRHLERISLTMSSGSLAIINDGSGSTVVSYVLARGSSTSTGIAANKEIQPGDSLSVPIPSAANSVLVVTSLGNVFSIKNPSLGARGASWTGWDALGGPGVNMQVFKSPSDDRRFYVSEGSALHCFSTLGSHLWSYDAGYGEITSVLPLSDGHVFVSYGYAGSSYSSYLVELDPGGNVVNIETGRLLRSNPQGQIGPVQRGSTSLYAIYDGIIFSSSGFVTSFSDQFHLAATDATRFFTYTLSLTDTGYDMLLRRYQADPNGVALAWENHFSLPFNPYTESAEFSSYNNGLFATLLLDPLTTDPNYPSLIYGSNPYLVAAADSGQAMYFGAMDGNGYSSIASDGTFVYLALPALSQVEVVSLLSKTLSYYPLPFPPAHLMYYYGYLFVASDAVVDVTKVTTNSKDPSRPQLSIVNSLRLHLYSAANTLPFERALHTPSFVVLNATHYAVIVRNSSGFGSLSIGRFLP